MPVLVEVFAVIMVYLFFRLIFAALFEDEGGAGVLCSILFSLLFWGSVL